MRARRLTNEPARGLPGAALPSNPVPIQDSAGALVFLLAYIFLDLSRLHEVLFPIPRLMLGLGFLMFVSSFVSGGLQRSYSRISGLFLLWVAIACASGPFGMYRKGTIDAFMGWMPHALIFFAGIGVLTAPDRCRKVLYTLAAVQIYLVIAPRLFGEEAKGRLGLTSATIGNANDYAALLLFASQGLMLLFVQRNKAVKLLAGVFLAAVPLLVMRTGSRGALLSIVALVILGTRRMALRQKIGIGLVCAIALFVSFAIAPDAARSRISVLTSANEGAADGVVDAQLGAAESGQLRREILIASIYATLRHPLLGVGLGNNILGTNAEAARRGQRLAWRESHNTYTQVSSELGIPGLVVYLALLVTCFKSLGRCIRLARTRPEWKDVLQMAMCARLGLISYCTTSLFLTHAYLFYVPVAAMLAYALGGWAERASALPAGVGLAAGQTGFPGTLDATPKKRISNHL